MEPTECLIPTFGVLTEQQVALINNNSFIINHKYGEVIFRQGRPVTHLIYLRSGLVKLYKQIEGKSEIILDVMQHGQFVGLTSIFYEKLYPYSVSSLEGGELIFVGAKDFRNVLVQNGEYSLRIMNILSSRVVYMINRLIAFTKKQVPGRLAEMLLYFSKNIYNNIVFNLPLTRQEIADMVQTTKESVSRTLTEFKNDRLIDVDERKITLISHDLLEILNKIG